MAGRAWLTAGPGGLIWLSFAGLLWLTGAPAAAQDWVPELQPPPGGSFYAADEAMVLVIPDEVAAGAAVELAVELDEFDVTALLQVEGGRLLLDPPEPLAKGMHQLRLVEYGSDGSIIARGAWSFEVRDGEALRRRQLSLGHILRGAVRGRRNCCRAKHGTCGHGKAAIGKAARGRTRPRRKGP